MGEAFWGTEIQERLISSGNIQTAREEDGKAYITFERGKARIKSYGEGIMRFTLTVSAFLNQSSLAVVLEPDDNVTAARDGDKLQVRCAGFSILLTDGRPEIDLNSQGGKSLLSLSQALFRARNRLIFRFALSPEARIYGLGEKTGYLNKRGSRYVMWNTDDPLHTPDKDPLYKSIPFIIVADGDKTFGLFLDSTARSEFDLGFTSRDQLEIAVYDEELDLYVIDGKNMAEVISRYTLLTGRMAMPPMWALGYQQCRWSYYPQEKVMDLASAFRKRDIPCDVIYLDIDYMDGYRVFTWSPDRFPEPAVMNQSLMEQGFRIVTIIDPGVKRDSDYDVYREGAQNGYFCKLPTGEVYHGKVWPGVSAYPDFSKAEARKWWGKKHAPLLFSGVSGIWNDMNEPSDFSPEAGDNRALATVPNDVMLDFDGDPRSFAKGHNAYGLLMCRATYEGFSDLKPDERPFIVTRSAYAGIQRYSAVWTGDNHSWWEHLAMSIPMHLNIGLSGVPFVGGDVGGFQGECSPELFIRWVQLGAFTPFFRAHSAIGTRNHEPWAFGPEAEHLAREAIKLRYSLLPYLYSTFKNACDTGLPVMRPLVLDFQEDVNTHELWDCFMIGPSLLVAPVLRPGDKKRVVYLPQGLWYDFHTREPITGGRYILADAPLDRIPLFVRAGAIIPRVRSEASTAFIDWSRLSLEVYAGASGSYNLYEDDGLSRDYQRDGYNLLDIRTTFGDGSAFKLNLSYVHKGYERGFRTATVSVYGLREGLVSPGLSYENGVYSFDLPASDTEFSFG